MFGVVDGGGLFAGLRGFDRRAGGGGMRRTKDEEGNTNIWAGCLLRSIAGWMHMIIGRIASLASMA